jgi:hypothetical protein
MPPGTKLTAEEEERIKAALMANPPLHHPS